MIRFSLSMLAAILFLTSACATTQVIDESWRKEKPLAGPESQVRTPKIEKVQLENGLTMLVSSDRALPLIDIKLVVMAGSSRDQKGKGGESELSFNLLDEGAGDLDALAITKGFADIGTGLLLAVGQDAGALGLPLLKPYLERGMELLSLIVQKPRFLETDFQRVQNLALASLVSRSVNPSTQAMESFYRNAFGENHPYGHTMSGTLQSVKSVTVGDVRSFYAKYFSPTHTAIVITGDISLSEAKALVQKHFGQWKHAPVAAPSPPSLPLRKQASIELISRPGAPQTFLLLGRPYLSAKDPDEYRLRVFNEIVGGMFNSRLNMNLREDKTWTYGARSSFDMLKNKGPFLVATSIQVPYAGQALQEIFKEFKKIREEDVSDNELILAKQGLINSLASKFETVSAASTQIAYLYIYDLPLDYFERWPERISQVSASDVRAVANQILAPSQFSIVAVGDLDAMKKPIEEMKLGKIKISF